MEDQVFVQEEYHIFRCSTCGLVFKDSILSSSNLATYYATFDFKRWEPARAFPTDRLVLGFLRSLPPGRSVLDFGCSTGRLLAEVSARHACFGYEINRAAAAEAACKSITIFDSLEGLQAHPSEFDVIILVDVFEHLDSPTSELRWLAGLIKPGGFLLIVTGNADCWAGAVDLPNFWYFRNIQHLCMFTRKYAGWLSANLQLQLHTWAESSHYDSTLIQKGVQMLRHFAFAVLRQRPSSVFAKVISVIPILRRAAKWHIPPPHSASRDHVVAIFAKERLRS